MKRFPRSRVWLLAGCLGVTMAFGFSSSRASCGSANCFLVTGTQEGMNDPGQVTLDFSYRYVPQDRKLSGSERVDEVLVPKVNFEDGEIEPDHHREISTHNILVGAAFGIGLTKRVSLGVDLPLFLDREHEHFDEVGTPEEHFTNGDGTTGFGDVRISARVAVLTRTKDLLTVGGGLKTPTGEYRLRDSEGSINEPTIQPGTGSWDPSFHLAYTHQWVPHRWEYFLAARYVLRTKNPLEYDFGEMSLFDAGVRFSPSNRLVLSLQLNGQSAPHDFFDGHLVASTGGRQVALTPGILVFGSSGLGFYAHVAVPVYQDVNESQLASRTALALGLSATF
jgi:outer membrane putative beta-barrel porin/alpha-amylase